MSFVGNVKKMVGVRSGRLVNDWAYDSRSSLLAAPVVADIDKDGRYEIIVGSKAGRLMAIDEQANELWSFNIHESVDPVEEMFLDAETINSINASPALADLTGDGKLNIIFGSEMGVVYCLDEKGKLMWSYKTNGGIRGSPLIADVNGDGRSEVVVGCTDKFLYILDREGQLIERFEQNAPIESTPGFYEETIIFGIADGTIVALTAGGTPKWSHKTRASVTAAPSFVKLDGVEVVLIGSTDNNLYCLDVDGELLWSFETDGAIYSSVAIADINGDGKQEIVLSSSDNSVYALNHEGELLWSFQTDFWIVDTPLIADIDGDGHVEIIVGSYDHNIYVLDGEGSYVLEYMPGLSGIVHQNGHYTDVMTSEPGEHVGKKLWQFRAAGVVVGCSLIDSKRFVVATKVGRIQLLSHKR